MKKSTKNNLITGLVLLLSVGVVGGLAGLTKGFKDWNFDSWLNNSTSKGDEEISIKEQGINVQYLKNSTTTENYEVRTFSYAVKEEYAKDSSITASLNYVDGTDCSNVMTMEIDEIKKEISLTCKEAFSKQIILNLVSKTNTKAKALIKVDYVKRLLDMKLGNSTIFFGADEKTNNVEKLDVSSLISATYSTVYSKDKDYSFDVALNSYSFNGFQYEGLVDHDFMKDSNATRRVGNALGMMIRNSFNTNQQIDKDDIWNLDSSVLWQSFLKEVSAQNYGCKSGTKWQYDGTVYFYFVGDVYSHETNRNIKINNIFYFTLNYDYSNYSIESSNLSHIEF